MSVEVNIGADTYRLPPKSAAALMVAEYGDGARNRDIDIIGPRTQTQLDTYWTEIDRLLTVTLSLNVAERTLLYDLLTDRYKEAMSDTDSDGDYARYIDTLRRKIAPPS